MKQVFISYPSANKAEAMEVTEYLERNGIQCFIAPRDIEGGKTYASVLMQALEECFVVLLIASEAINDSEHVLNEVDAIVNKKKVLLPVFIENFEMKDEYRYYLGRKQWVTAYPDALNCYFDEIYNAVVENLPADKRRDLLKDEPKEAEEEESSNKTTVFEYNAERGVMINPADHQRNVSFRTDTFVNMMGGIFARVKDLLGEEEAQQIFYESGYSSGKNFAERINNLWNTGFNAKGIQMKFDKWCSFDSAVGWGKFSADIHFDEAQDTITGTICINEAFIVDNKNRRKICAFIKGYCTGVVEIFLNSADVELVCRECPLQSRLNTKCVFDFKLA